MRGIGRDQADEQAELDSGHEPVGAERLAIRYCDAQDDREGDEDRDRESDRPAGLDEDPVSVRTRELSRSFGAGHAATLTVT